MGKLDGKVAVVTGGNSGIGLATAKEFIEEGARVVITGRSQEGLDNALKTLGGNGYAVQGDVSNSANLDQLFDTVKNRYGGIDILFANAGVAQMAPIEQVSEEDFDNHFDINVKGLFFTVQKALPLMKDGGSIVLNASIVSKKGFGNFSVYSATKAAVRSFARTWATDLKDRNIRVNTVSPGPIETPIYGKFGLPQEQLEAMGTAFAGMVPLGRFGQPNEIGKAVVFLASNDGSYVNGVDLAVDGGLSQV